MREAVAGCDGCDRVRWVRCGTRPGCAGAAACRERCARRRRRAAHHRRGAASRALHGLRRSTCEAPARLPRPVSARHWSWRGARLVSRAASTPSTSWRWTSWQPTARASASRGSVRPAAVEREWIQPTSTVDRTSVRLRERPRARGARRALRRDRAQRNTGAGRCTCGSAASRRGMARPRARRRRRAAPAAAAICRASTWTCPRSSIRPLRRPRRSRDIDLEAHFRSM